MWLVEVNSYSKSLNVNGFFSSFMQVSDQETQLLNMRDINLALVVKTVDNALKRINFYPVDSQKQFTNIYLTVGLHYPPIKKVGSASYTARLNRLLR